jgi:hypothetical protein
MGSVIDYTDCPNCGQEAISDFYYKTGEEYINCSHCGFYRYVELHPDVQDLSAIKDSDWKITECTDPYGAYRIQYSNAAGNNSAGYMCGTLETEAVYDEICERIMNDADVEFASVSRLIDGSTVEEVLIDKSQNK